MIEIAKFTKVKCRRNAMGQNKEKLYPKITLFIILSTFIKGNMDDQEKINNMVQGVKKRMNWPKLYSE